jgi:DNA-binding CsgD family transcriptional regulator
MLPALAEIVTNLVSLQLAPDTTAAVLGAVLAPLLRCSDVDPASEDPMKIRRKRAGRPRSKRQSDPRRRRKYKRHAPTEARDRALAALRAKPDATSTEIAKIAKVSRSTVVNAREELAKQAREEAREAGSTTAKPTERQQRAQHFLREQLAHGPKSASAVEDAAVKAHIGETVLDRARADLGVISSRSNTGGSQAVQWSLPG